MAESLWNGYRIRVKEPLVIAPKSAEGGPEIMSVSPKPKVRVLTDALEIDNRPVPVLESPDGYRIYNMPPVRDLGEAARNYVEALGAKSQ